MCLFSAAFAVQWCYPSNTTLQASAGSLMLIVALLVTWCIWTARDRSNFWWFQPDPSQVEHKEFEEDEKDSNAPFGTLGFDTLRGFTMSLKKLLTFKSVPCESHAMQDATNLRVVRDPP
jgi:hypothetical protein